ncbi:hypothetical protein SHIRM173S_03702 [Streptomyces hirsutus]
MTHFDVYISDDGFARIGQAPVAPVPGESVHEAVLDHLQRYAEQYGTAVQATVTDGPGDAHFTLEVAPDGSSRVLVPEEPGEPEVPEGPTEPEVPEDSENLEVSEAPAPVPPPVAGSAIAAAVARARATAAGDTANPPVRISIPAQATALEPESYRARSRPWSGRRNRTRPPSRNRHRHPTHPRSRHAGPHGASPRNCPPPWPPWTCRPS